jgi:hypothetical protein
MDIGPGYRRGLLARRQAAERGGQTALVVEQLVERDEIIHAEGSTAGSRFAELSRSTPSLHRHSRGGEDLDHPSFCLAHGSAATGRAAEAVAAVGLAFGDAH